MSISLLSVQVELPSELVACGPAVQSVTMPVVFVETALVVLNKAAGG